ncbi:MAG TPA: thioredoxin [bacterium]|nr:thioredoxin [bacterium]
MSEILELTADNFKAEVLESSLPVVVDFWAPWCGACKIMAPMIDDLASQLAGQVKIVKVDANDPVNQSLLTEYGVQGLPTIKIFKAGQVVGEMSGLRQQDALKSDILAKIA